MLGTLSVFLPETVYFVTLVLFYNLLHSISYFYEQINSKKPMPTHL